MGRQNNGEFLQWVDDAVEHHEIEDDGRTVDSAVIQNHIHARCTRDGGQFGTCSGRFEMRNTLRPGVSTLCGGLQGGSLVLRT